MYTGQTMKLDTYKLKLEDVIFNFAYDNTKKAKNEINKVLESDVEKDEDAEKLKAKASKETKKLVHDSLIKDER